MLSIGSLSSSTASVKYYQQDGHLDKEDNGGIWFGKAATELKLQGEVKPDDFANILKGILPNNIIMAKGAKERKLGIDLTFSAPKSVSIMSQVANDKNIMELHREAVKVALTYIENNLLQTKINKDGKFSGQKADNMVVALFEHGTSRNMDPQLHTHCILANLTKRFDGKWRAINYKNIYDNQLLIGAIYRSELAFSLNKIGYKTLLTHNDARFEILGVPQDLIEKFSSRRQEITTAMQDYDIKNAKTAQKAALYTRQNKQTIDPKTIKQNWRDILSESGHNLDNLTSNNEHKNIETNFLAKSKDYIIYYLNKIITSFADYSKKGNIAKKAVEYSCLHLSERSANFPLKDIYRNAIAYGLGKISFSNIQKAFNKLKKEGQIIDQGKETFTTDQAVLLETNIIQMMQNGKNKTDKIVSNKILASKLSNIEGLNPTQKEALNLILTSKDKIIGIQGYAGVGKTYMMQKLNLQIKANNWQITGLAPTVNAAQLLFKETGIKSQTLHSFLLKHRNIIEEKPSKAIDNKDKNSGVRQVILLDESSMAASSHIYGLLKIADILGSKIVLLGDEKQLSAIEAGKPFAQLLENGMSHVKMTQIIRQNNHQLKASVYAAREGKITVAIDKISKNISQTMNPALDSANHWLKLTPQERSNYLILAPSHNIRKQINAIIRVSLKNEGSISGDILNIDVYTDRRLTKAQTSRAMNFQRGNIVKLADIDKKIANANNCYFEVISVDGDKNTVKLKDKEGQRIFDWRPKYPDSYNKNDVFTKDTIPVQSGDLLRFTKNFKAAGIINGLLVSVKSFDDKELVLLDKEDRIYKLPINSEAIKYLDYAYALTVHSAQGKTINNVIAAINSGDKLLNNQQLFYVALSRAKEKVFLYVNNLQDFKNNLYLTTGEKSSAISSIREGLPFLSEKRDSFIAQIANITSDNNKDIFDKNLQKKSQDKDMSMDNS